MPSPHSYVQITFVQIPILIQSNSGIHLNQWFSTCIRAVTKPNVAHHAECYSLCAEHN